MFFIWFDLRIAAETKPTAAAASSATQEDKSAGDEEGLFIYA